MLDETSLKLLAALNGVCTGGGFKIVEEGELLPNLPLNADELGRTMAFLEEKRLIEIRYAEDGAYCLRLLPAGRGYSERLAGERREAVKSRRDMFLYAALGAFAGGALAGLLVLLLSLLV